jgi:hypothetical protein
MISNNTIALLPDWHHDTIALSIRFVRTSEHLRLGDADPHLKVGMTINYHDLIGHRKSA